MTDLSAPMIISNTVIERIHESFNWSKHIQTVISKISRDIGIIYKIKGYLLRTARLQIYHSFVQSHQNYCSLVRGFTSKSNIEKLFCKQKKGLRAGISGFINYRYRDGEIADHTKSVF